MEHLLKKKEIVGIFLRNNILVNRDVLNRLSQPNIVDQWHNALTTGTHPQELIAPKQTNSSVKITWQYDELPKKRSVQDFIDYFNARYRAIHKLLNGRQELQNLTSISRIRLKKEREKASIIGIIADKGTTKNEHIMLTLEDSTGRIKVLITKKNEQLYQQAKDLVYDEVIGINGTTAEDIIFAETLVLPDVPIQEPKRAPEEAYAAVLSCVHVGSALFEHEKFDNFLQWLNGTWGTPEQQAVVSKLKYVFVCGDLVDGVGIYPQHEKELAITDIREQYKEFARLFSQVPKHITLILCPGNHDAGRISEPQPKLSKQYAAPLYELPNAILTCNPCMLNIHSGEQFPGLDVLMYHGFSFDDYSECVPSIKNSGAHISDRAALVMKFLLQRRHLAPQHTSTLYIPDARMDPLVIEKVPDLFFSGHIHKAGTLQYRGTTIVAGSCFQKKTKFQEKVGHDPETGVVPVVNLQTRDVTMMRF
ncbi:metallophosphoesterase [Candidatus Woesearchaeota archaeon]|nr:metallophosphoesterase [Candidatus Woesearchaeota archaeon]